MGDQSFNNRGKGSIIRQFAKSQCTNQRIDNDGDGLDAGQFIGYGDAVAAAAAKALLDGDSQGATPAALKEQAVIRPDLHLAFTASRGTPVVSVRTAKGFLGQFVWRPLDHEPFTAFRQTAGSLAKNHRALEHRRLGHQLFEALFGNKLWAQVQTLHTEANPQHNMLHIHLSFDPKEPTAASARLLPWEWLFHNHQFLARDGRHFLTRGLIDETAQLPQTIDNFAIGVVHHTNFRDSHLVIHALREGPAVRSTANYLKEWCEPDWDYFVNEWPHWRDSLQTGHQAIFHFVGHGKFDPLQQRGSLQFPHQKPHAPTPPDNSATAYQGIPAANVGSTLMRACKQPPWVVLNACESGNAGENPSEKLADGVAATLLDQGCPMVLAMVGSVYIDMVNPFNQSFYEALNRYGHLGLAVHHARAALESDFPNHLHWTCPVVYLRTPSPKG